jgi:hypothetical protein
MRTHSPLAHWSFPAFGPGARGARGDGYGGSRCSPRCQRLAGLRRFCARAWACAVLFLFALICSAADKPSLEYPVKAAFIYNLAKFIEWPAARMPQADTPLVFGIVGEDPFGPILDELVAKENAKRSGTSGGWRVEVRRLNPSDDLTQCHILFISRSALDSLAQILGVVKSQSVLTVSEINGFSRRGGMLGLNVVDDVLKTELNLDVAESAGLKVSSRLSKVVQIVRGEGATKR